MAAYGAYILHVGCMQGREPWPREARPLQCIVTILTYSRHVHLESPSIRDHVHWPGPREAQPQLEAINRVSAYVYVSAFLELLSDIVGFCVHPCLCNGLQARLGCPLWPLSMMPGLINQPPPYPDLLYMYAHIYSCVQM